MDNGASSYHRFLEGDRDGFAQIVYDYYDGLVLYLNTWLNNLHDAEDMAQETLVVLVSKKPEFEGKSSFKTWLYGIGRNVTVAYLRKNHRIVAASPEDLTLLSEQEQKTDYTVQALGTNEMYNGCYDAEISPTVSVEWAYNLNRFWSVVGSLGGNRVRASYFDPFNNALLNSETAYMFDVLAGVRYRWEHSKNFSLYSQLQLGGTFNTPAEYWSRNKTSQSHIGFQITGLGLTFGSRLFGLAEFGWGTEYFGVAVVTGARVGLGYKF